MESEPTKPQILRQALHLLDGLAFDSDLEVVQDSGDVLLLLISTWRKKVTPEEARDLIVERVRQALLYCVKYEDVYRRLNGNKAFWYLILADWNSVHETSPFPPASIQKVISLFVGARRRYEAELSSSDKASFSGIAINVRLTMFVDRWIAIVDDVNIAMAERASRSLPSLKPPKGVDASTLGSRTWPPTHFSAVDIAIIGQAAIREKVFGIDHLHKVEDKNIPVYPTDQSPPLDVRSYLCWMTLEETKPRSPIALFPAPVAFMSDNQRCEWYLPTGHKSRSYATVDEFIDYAHEEFKTTVAGTMQKRKHVMGLFTPWFFEKEWLTATAQEKDQPIPTVWQGSCYRAGMVISLTRIRRVHGRQTCRLLIFKPDQPHYWRPSQPSERRKKQDAWVGGLVNKLRRHFQLEEGWIGGRSQHHYGPSLDERPVTADTIEISCEIIQEILMNNSWLPTTEVKLREREFILMNLPRIE
ncbi:hypothetical protein Hte_000086 [Hypoxylon texense]